MLRWFSSMRNRFQGHYKNHYSRGAADMESELNSLKRVVGANGFEPSTSWSRTRESKNLKPCRCRTYVRSLLQNPPSVVPLVPHGLTVASDSLSVSTGPSQQQGCARVNCWFFMRNAEGNNDERAFCELVVAAFMMLLAERQYVAQGEKKI